MIDCCNCGVEIPHGKTLWCASLEDEAACSKWCEVEHADRGCPHETISDYRTPEWYRLNGLEFGGLK
jgi:hypothetical protein